MGSITMDKFKDLIEAPCQHQFKMVDTEGHYLSVDGLVYHPPSVLLKILN